MRKIIVLTCLLVFLLSMTVGAVDNTLTVGISTDPDTLDPHQTTLIKSLTIMGHVIEPLFTLNKTREIVPLLAKSYEWSDDGLEMTVELKEGIKFHNGGEMTSEDVKASYLRYFELSPMASYLPGDAGGIYQIDTPDKYTVVFHFKEKKPLALYHMADGHVSIMPKEWLENNKEDIGLTTLVGTGPYEFVDWVSGSKIVMKRNENYSHGPDFISNKGPAKMENLVFRVIPEESTLMAELTSGNVDISVDVPVRFIDQVENDPGVKVETKPRYSVWFLDLNMQQDIIQDKNVRMAIAHAINKQNIIKGAWFGAAPEANGLLNEAILGYWPGVKDVSYDYNPEKAKELLAEAGWKDSDGDGIRDKNGEPLSLKLISHNRDTIKRMSLVVQQSLSEIGIKVKVDTAETGRHYEKLRGGDFDIGMVGNVWWNGQPYLWFVSHGESSANYTHWNNPEINKNLEIAGNDMDPEKRKQALNEVQRITAESAAWIPLVSDVQVLAAKNNVKGIDELKTHPWWPPLMRALVLTK